MRKSKREPQDPDTPTRAELAQWRREERAARAAERAVEREYNRVNPEFIALRAPTVSYKAKQRIRELSGKPVFRPGKPNWRRGFKAALAKAMDQHRARRSGLRFVGVSAGGVGVKRGSGLFAGKGSLGSPETRSGNPGVQEK